MTALIFNLLETFINTSLEGEERKNFSDSFERYYLDFNRSDCRTILLAERDSYKFLAVFLAAVAARKSVFLANPDWREREWREVLDGKFDRYCGDTIPDYVVTEPKPHLENTILIPTGGTSGKIRFAIHTIDTLSESVRGFREYFSIDIINSFCLLPLYHVSGLMQFIRVFLTGGTFKTIPYSYLKTERIYIENKRDFFISLVPTQLQFFLENSPEWLSGFKTVLLGGASPWLSLLESAREYRIPLSLTYGMTETASGIVILKPEDFLNGNNSNGQVLPHTKLTIDAKNRIIINSRSLFLGYYPNLNQFAEFISDDIGYFDVDNYLYILGRDSQKIITGGENVYPIEIERAILETGLVRDVAVIGIDDSRWGQSIVCFYVPINNGIKQEDIREILKTKIANYKIPKRWIILEQIPRNKQGKILIEELKLSIE